MAKRQVTQQKLLVWQGGQDHCHIQYGSDGEWANLACLPDGDAQHFMDQSLVVPLMQAAHACSQGVQEADQLLHLVLIAISQSLLLHCPELIYQAARAQLDRHYPFCWTELAMAVLAAQADKYFEQYWILEQ